MVLDVGIVDDPERVGYYSGIIESLFAVMSFVFGEWFPAHCRQRCDSNHLY